MLPMYLTWTFRDISEVVLTIALIVVLMGAFAVVPFIAQYYIDDRRDVAKTDAATPGDGAKPAA
jgi:hypothetical protein